MVCTRAATGTGGGNAGDGGQGFFLFALSY
jgi:hypothetical protein